MTSSINHQARHKNLFVCQVVTLSMFTTDFFFEGSPLERMQAKAKESIQPLVFLLEEPPL